MTNSIITANAADNANLSASLRTLTGHVLNAAEENIRTALGPDVENYSALELRSMVTVEAFRLTQGMDLAAIYARGELAAQIEREGLFTVHPNGYTTLEQMAQSQGISVSELSDTRALCSVIFPYIENEMGLSMAEQWNSIGKSSFREMVPALRALITGEQPSHTSVREAVQNMLSVARASVEASGSLTGDEAQDLRAVRQEAVRQLLVAGATTPTRQLRRAIRPSRTSPVNIVNLQVDESAYFAVVQIPSREQLDMFNRLMGDHADIFNIDARNNTMANQVSGIRAMFGG